MRADGFRDFTCDMRRRRPFIVFNPTAGIPRERFFAAVIARLKHRGAIATVVEPAHSKEVAALVQSACGSHDMIVAAGGDGTIRQAAASMDFSGVPLGIIPLGTGNVFAREIGLRRDSVHVADTLLDGEVTSVRGAYANGEPFYLMAGVGFDARVIDALNLPLKRILGRAAYAPAMLRVLRQPLEWLDVMIDRQLYRANWAIIANARHYGGNFIVAPEASIFKSGLKIVLVSAANRPSLMWQLSKLARSAMVQPNNLAVRVIDGTEITVVRSTSGSRPVPVQVDGDAFGSLPLHIDANGPQLRLILPS